MKYKTITNLILCGMLYCEGVSAQNFKLQDSGYFTNRGINVMAFDDYYPEGHQGGVTLIMNGKRLAANGNIRLEATPGQWQPLPKQTKRNVDKSTNTIVTQLCYPDSSRHLRGANPMIYPDIQFNYTVSVKGTDKGVVITVDLDRPIPDKYNGKIGFNMELYPGELLDEPWLMDGKSGIFPRQANGPTEAIVSNMKYIGNYNHASEGSKDKADIKSLIGNGYNPIVADNIIASPYATGHCFTACPEDSLRRFTITSKQEMKLYDGRMNHNSNWFVLRSEIPARATKAAVEWVLTPQVTDSWMYAPVIQTSQVGYHPDQPKTAVIEMDARDTRRHKATLYSIGKDGEQAVLSSTVKDWGRFMRYNYAKFDFSGIKTAGLYRIRYGNSCSSIFRIDKDVYDRGVWQPVLEYFLPVQMCHMRVNEKYRVWHDCCHLDDARMAQPGCHFDNYTQEARMLTRYKAGQQVPGLNVGGWHDAGDFDLRVESQAGEAYILTLAQECFHPNMDETTIDQKRHITEINQPDGKPDILQQIEHGALSVVAGYKSLGRLYRGIICSDLRQYVMLGDAADMTDRKTGTTDDRWVFTEDNPKQELKTAAELAAVSRVMKGFNDTLSIQCLNIAKELYSITPDKNAILSKTQAATELYLTTGESVYKNYLLKQVNFITMNINETGWFVGRAAKAMKDKDFDTAIHKSLLRLNKEMDRISNTTPYGVPYEPTIWGQGWNISAMGAREYLLMKSYPDIFNAKLMYNALNFILGCHPGSNTRSFASGVGTHSVLTAYCANRADWSYIPGGVISGTAVIQPDFPELLTFPYIWQQTEYVLGGGSSRYMFMVLAAQSLLNKK